MSDFGIHSPLRYFHSANDFDVDAHATQVVTEGVVQDGGLFQSNFETIRHSRFTHRQILTVNAASNSVTGIDDVVRFTPKEVVNYLAIQPSARNNDVIVSLRPIEFYNIGGTFYAVGDFLVRAGSGLQMYRFPTERNYLFYFYIVPPAGYSAPYSDVISVSFGYLPDGLEKVAVG